jgi:uncharacterized coiled-coil protein SlyX
VDDERLERLELKLAYLEQSSQELGDVVYRQQLELDALRDRVARLADRISDLAEQGREPSDEDELPPHY